MATEVVPLAVSPSIKFNSAVVTVAPSIISNSASVIAAEPIVNPAAVTYPEASIVKPVVNAPLTSQVPLISIAVAVKSISLVAPNDNTVALEPCIN